MNSRIPPYVRVSLCFVPKDRSCIEETCKEKKRREKGKEKGDNLGWIGGMLRAKRPLDTSKLDNSYFTR